MERSKSAGRESDERTSETSGRVSTIELTYAAGACKADSLKPRPPFETGRDAFSQLQSKIGPPAMSERASRTKPSREEAASLESSGGHDLKENANLGKDGALTK